MAGDAYYDPMGNHVPIVVENLGPETTLSHFATYTYRNKLFVTDLGDLVVCVYDNAADNNQGKYRWVSLHSGTIFAHQRITARPVNATLSHKEL